VLRDPEAPSRSGFGTPLTATKLKAVATPRARLEAGAQLTISGGQSPCETRAVPTLWASAQGLLERARGVVSGVKRPVARLNPLPWLKRGPMVGLRWLKGVVGGLSRPAETGVTGVIVAAATLSGYLASLLNGSAGSTVLNVIAAAFAAIALFLAIHIAAKAVHGGRRSSLELLSFEPSTDGVLKGPEFGWGPAAWMRLRVWNRSSEDTASYVRIVIRRVIAHGVDGRSTDASAPAVATTWPVFISKLPTTMRRPSHTWRRTRSDTSTWPS
jgi:hypothetical protein